MKNSTIAILVVAFLAVGGGSFYAGQHMAKNSRPTSGRMFTQQGQMGGRTAQGANRMGTFVAGEVISKDATSITVKLRDGGSNIVFLSDKTTVQKSTEGALSDIDAGEQVTVTGTKNSDGSFTAQSVQIRPAMPAPAGQQAPAQAK